MASYRHSQNLKSLNLRKNEHIDPFYHLGRHSHYDLITPLEAAKMLIFSQNDYDFQQPKIV